MNGKYRKEVHLDDDTISRLQLLADKRQWSLKKYMEHVLEQSSKRVYKEWLLLQPKQSTKK